MPDLILSWGDIGLGYGTEVTGPETVDAGGVGVTVTNSVQDEGATLFTVNNPMFNAAGEGIPDQSGLKILGAGGEGGSDDTSITTFTFGSTDALYSDAVSDVTFRVHDIDGGSINDVDNLTGGSDHVDILNIRAFDASGTEIPVVFTTGASTALSGNTLTGSGDGDAQTAASSTFVSIAGPVARIEFDYNNGDTGEQEVIVSDLLFSTIDATDNDDPVAVDDSATTAVDTLLEDIDVLGNDSDPDGDPLTVTSATSPDGTVTINGDGTLNFDPNGGFSGPTTITYVISDGNGGTDSGTVDVTVTDAPNTTPVAVDDSATTPVDTLIEDIDVLGNDSDPDGDPLTVISATSPDGTVTINGDGTLNFDPNGGFTGPTTISYVISDGNGGADTGSVAVTVTDDLNEDPIAVDDAPLSTNEGVAITGIDVLGNDSDPDGDPLTVTGATAPNGTVLVNGDGTLNYTPDAGFLGTDTVTYVISDGNGGTDTASFTVSVTDPALNEDPDALNDVLLAQSGVNVPVVDVLGNDSDPDGDPLTVTAASTPNGTVTINGDGTLSYTADPGFTGTDLISYTVDDGNGGTDTAIVRVTVRAPSGDNDAPVAVDDSATTPVDTLIEDIDVLGNDSDPDGDPLTVISATSPDGTVTINGDGTLNFDPNGGFTGPTTISYVISDGNGGTDTGSVAVTVTSPGNTAPVAVDDSGTTPVDTLLEDIDVLGNDSDPEGDPLTVTAATSPEGTVTINGDNTLNFDPTPGFTGEATITYTIDDGNGGTDVGQVAITVGDTNSDPNADPDSATTPLDTPITVFPLGNDTDPEGDPLTITAASAPNGSVTISPDGTSVTYTPDLGFTGVDSISYTISDGNGGTDTTSIQVIVDSTPLDGIVEGTAGDDLIIADDPATPGDEAYMGDPEGDEIDNSDAILPEAGAQDDVVEAGAGDDTVVSGLGDDFVTAGEGDDSVTTGEGNDTVFGGEGLDTIDTGEGDDSIFSGDGADSITTGDGVDTVLAGLGDDVIDTSGTIPLLDNSPFPSIPVDSDPEDDRDYVDADEGNDLITTGDDADTIIAGEGDDTINSGIDDDIVIADGGDDLIFDEHGADYVEGGEGNDTINVGTDTFTDYVGDDPNLPLIDSGITFVTDPDVDDGKDTVFGGAGNDVINTGDDADSIDGGDDDDTINAGIDDDTVRGGDGNDSILGGHGADTIAGGNGNDFIDAGHTGTVTDFEDEPDATEPAGLELNDRDVVYAGNGDDTVFGGDDDDFITGGSGRDFIDGGIDEDTIDGGSGDDTLVGGAGDDSIVGGSGFDSITGDDGDDTLEGGISDDTLTGGAGADSIFGGEGEDSIVGATTGDVVDGGTGPSAADDEIDTLDLRGAGAAENVGGSLSITYTSADREDGIVNFLDAGGATTGTMSFTEIENVIPCFTPGTMIATPQGERKVEDLQVGDRVITRDNGIQEIRWAGAKELSGQDLQNAPHLKPVLIQAGALGHNLPEVDILVSPQHRMLLTTDQAAMYFEEREVLVAAKHLTMLDGVDEVETSGTTYIHIMFDQHEVVLSNGTWSESFQPGEHSLDGIGAEQRAEILELFPELGSAEGVGEYSAARRTLKKFEAKLIFS